MYVHFLFDSYLKKSEVDSTKLDATDKVLMKQGTSYPIANITLASNGHYKITSEDRSEQWFVFSNHVAVFKEGEVLSVNEKDFRTANQIDAKEIPDAMVSRKKNEENSIIIQGLGEVDLFDSIIPKGNFTWNEATHGGTRLPQSKDHTDAIVRMARELQKVRDLLDLPMHITSWYRPEPFNSAAGGAKYSQHLTGGAVDFYVDGMSSWDIMDMIDGMWEGGLGTYAYLPDIVHLDVRGYKARW